MVKLKDHEYKWWLMKDSEVLVGNRASRKLSKGKHGWIGSFLSGSHQSGQIQRAADGAVISPSFPTSTKAGPMWDAESATVLVVLTELRTLWFPPLQEISIAIWNSGIWMTKSLPNRKEEVQQEQKEEGRAQGNQSSAGLLHWKKKQSQDSSRKKTNSVGLLTWATGLSKSYELIVRSGDRTLLPWILNPETLEV